MDISVNFPLYNLRRQVQAIIISLGEVAQKMCKEFTEGGEGEWGGGESEQRVWGMSEGGEGEGGKESERRV